MPGTKVAEALRREQIVVAAYDVAVRGGLRAINIRDVAKKCGSSTGLVMFHFGTKEHLVLALLDWVLAKTTTLSIGPDIESITNPLDRLIALLRQEMTRLSTESRRNRLFFEFWSEGMWNRAVRVRMQRELDRYRAAFRPMADAVISGDPVRYAGVTPDDLAAVSVAFIKGCAVQSMVEPTLDVAGFVRAAETLLMSPHAVASPSADLSI